jgi:thioredoxin reductase (NADPH)
VGAVSGRFHGDAVFDAGYEPPVAGVELSKQGCAPPRGPKAIHVVATITEAPERLERQEEMFPRLSDAQMARIVRFGRERTVRRGEVLFEPGQVAPKLYIVLRGGIDLLRSSFLGEELIRTVRRGEFTGELNFLAGRQALVTARVREDGETLEIPRDELRRIVVGDAELSDVLMRAFLLRRAALIARNIGGAVMVGSRHSAATLELKEFLAHNGQPYTYIDVESASEVQQLLERFGVRVEDVPVILCGHDTVLRNPSRARVAECLGFSPRLDEALVHDVVIIGAGPAGMAAAVYAASEGLDVVVVDAEAPGGQAGCSSKIENYLGFPTGISGQDLAHRAYAQAEKFGADIVVARSAQGLACNRTPYQVLLDESGRLLARSVVLAQGACYRRPDVANLSRFEGTGVYYAATSLEAQLCQEEEVVVVGGGNSAGQAAVFLATSAAHVHVLVRSGGLCETMSAYLVRRIRESAKITVHTHTELDLLEGDRELERLGWRNNVTGETERHRIRHVFVMTGADPNTGWLRRCVALDDNGFVKTGQDLAPDDLTAWTATRRPYMLETSIRGVFAVGDVRSGSVKRVASAVGEGAMCVQLLHKVLAE